MNGRQRLRPAAATPESRSRLDSWKEIASYFGRSEKTVRRWEETEGLPVHRLLHEKRGSVYGYTGELDAWRDARTADAKCEREPSSNGAKVVAQEIAIAGLESLQKAPDLPGRRWARWLVALIVAGIISLTGLLLGIHSDRLRDVRDLIVHGRNPVRIQSLVVLPFQALSGDTDKEYFADGMTEQLITEVAIISSLRVISRTSAMHYKGTTKSLPEIARELNVDAVVEGSIMRSGTRVRLMVQLVSPSPEHNLWAGVYEGDIRDVLSLQRDVARNIASKIQTNLASASPVSSGASKRLDPETYENYLRGRHFLARRNSEAMKKAVGYFQKAVQRDPQYAQAYSGLAVAYNLLGTYELLPPEESFPKVMEFANKALQLDNALSEAYTARAAAASNWEFEWRAAERDFQRAIGLDPSSAITHHWYGEHLINIGKAERAISELKRARDLDPLSLPINSTLGRVYRDARRYPEAIQQCRKTLELDPNFSMGHWCLGQAYMGAGRYVAAVPELELANAFGTTPLLASDLGYAYAAVGKNAEARAILQSLKQKAQSAYVPPYLIATLYVAFGEKDEAFKWLERAYRERDAHITYLALDPKMDPLRSDPRFRALIQRLKLPE